MSLFRKSAGDVGLLDLPKVVAVRRDAARRGRLFAKPDMTYLFWEATLRCNLRCRHCGSSCEGKSPVRELETTEVKAILDTIAQDFNAKRIFVSVTGGEPLLRKDLFEVVAHMTSLGMRSCIVTNGTLLDREKAQALWDAGMRTICVSIDGLEDEHEAVRGKGSWRKALDGIATARAIGFRRVEAITCVRPVHLDHLPEIEKAVRAAGATMQRLITIDRMGRAELDGPDLWLEPPQVRQLFDYLETRRAEIKKTKEKFDVRFSCGGFLGVQRELKVRPGDSQCFAGLCVASILADGQVSACPSLPRSMAQGSALERRFSEIWHTEFKQHRDMAWRKTGPCEDCSWFEVCGGGGLHERLVQPDEFCWLDRQDGDTTRAPA
jgi:radical SAM protein with 4Fe4S-binding SPASM domain